MTNAIGHDYRRELFIARARQFAKAAAFLGGLFLVATAGHALTAYIARSFT